MPNVREPRPLLQAIATTRTCVASIALATLALGCTVDTRSGDAGPPVDAELADAGTADAGRLDAGVQADAGLADDAGPPDSGTEDAGTQDAGSTDAGFTDGGLDAATDAGGIRDAGRDRRPGPGDLVIVEIQGNPQGATDEQAEYIELLNVSGRTLDLRGVRLTHVIYPSSGTAPDSSTAIEDIDEAVVVLAGGRVLLTRSTGGFFGGATVDFVYSSFVFQNSSAINRLRLMVPTWDETEPPDAADVIDEVHTQSGVFGGALRARGWQLNPALGPASAALNDDPSNFCHAEAVPALEYRASNWGTPREPNICP